MFVFVFPFLLFSSFFRKGIIITTIEVPGPCARKIDSGIRYYAKFLEFTWGRGALYFFVGSLQASNWNMLGKFSFMLSFY